jgi:hypothetical protein
MRWDRGTELGQRYRVDTEVTKLAKIAQIV